MWYFRKDDTKSKLKELDAKIEAIEKTRDSLKLVNQNLSKDYSKLETKIKKKF